MKRGAKTAMLLSALGLVAGGALVAAQHGFAPSRTSSALNVMPSALLLTENAATPEMHSRNDSATPRADARRSAGREYVSAPVAEPGAAPSYVPVSAGLKPLIRGPYRALPNILMQTEGRDISTLGRLGVFLYADPAAEGAVPLVQVAGQEELHVSPHFKLKDFISDDGVSYARISPVLVEALEQVQMFAGAPIHINSAYRHPLRNFSKEVGGAGRSQHMAGLAADISSAELSPVELAESALAALGCNIGIGLGRTFIHLDMRGYPASWVTEDAGVAEADFDAWVLDVCYGVDEVDSLKRPMVDTLNERLHDPVARSGSSEPFTRGEEAAPTADSVVDAALVEMYRDEIRAYAHLQHRRGMAGAVVLDLRPEMSTADLGYTLGFAPAGSQDATHLGVDQLLDGVSPDRYIIFAIRKPDGRTITGAMTRGQ